MEILKMMYAFMMTGLFAIGGGLATIPFLQDMVDKYGWFSLEELLDMVAISESTPGPIGINMATFAGIKVGGFLGGVLATLALTLPSVVVILLLIPVLDKYRTSPFTEAIFYGLRPTSTALIAAALVGFVKMVLFHSGIVSLGGLDLKNLVFLLAFIGLLKLREIHPIGLIVLGAVFGMVFKLA